MSHVNLMRGLFHVSSCQHVLKVHSTESFDAAMHFQFDRVSLMAFIAPGNYGGFFSDFYFTISPLNRTLGRLGLRENLRSYDAIACFIDKSSDEALADSKEELNSLLSDSKISQPIVILIHTENASGYANNSELISEFELEDVIEKRKGCVSIFAYSLSPTQFVGCLEGQL